MVDLKSLTLAVSLRVVAAVFLSNYLSQSPEFVTPWNSFKRIKEAVYLQNEYKISPYVGDSFHLMPMLLKGIGPFTHISHAWIVVSIALDIFIALLLQFSARVYLNKKGVLPNMLNDGETYARYVCLMYMFNPMAIGACAIGSISTLLNFLIALFITLVFYNCFNLASILLTISIFIYPYYVILLAPLMIAAKGQRLTALSTFFASFASMFAVNSLIEDQSIFIPKTFYFFWSFPDLSPNVGLFWYFFVFIFEQYHTFFIWTFQLVAILPVIPLAFTLGNDVTVLTFACLGHVSVLSSYPSYAEATILIALYPMFIKFLRYSRYTLIGFGSIVAAFVLSPIMWRMWMITGSGNANFYFAITIVYVLALSFLTVDIMYNYARFDFSERCAQAEITESDKIPEEYGIAGFIPFLPGIKSYLKPLILQ